GHTRGSRFILTPRIPQARRLPASAPRGRARRVRPRIAARPAMNGTCPCGGVTVTVPSKPDYLNSCDCTLCFRLGALWGYFDPVEVTVAGETKAFTRTDIEVW